jgi:hypothetical protein
VIQQLEQDRAMASKRARRMKEELKQAQAERGTAIKAVVELKNKLTTLKETSRKEIAALQAKVVKVGMSVFSPSSMTVGHNLDGACGHIKAFGLSLVPRQKKSCTESLLG